MDPRLRGDDTVAMWTAVPPEENTDMSHGLMRHSREGGNP